MTSIQKGLHRFATCVDAAFRRCPVKGGRTTLAVGGFLLGTLLLSVSPAASQNVLVDRGTFLLSRGGDTIGTEDFTIRRSGVGAGVKVVGTGEVSVEVDGRRHTISSALETTGPGAVVTAYQVKESGAVESELYMTLGGNRFQAKVVTPQGEQVREYRATPVLVLLEEWMAHHFYFASARLSGSSATVPALVPRSGERIELRIFDEGSDRIQVAGRTVEARHLTIVNDQERDLWTDDRGRILLVVNRTTGVRAERTELPD